MLFRVGRAAGILSSSREGSQVDDSSTLEHFLEQIDAADEVMRQQAAQGQVPSASASLQPNENPSLEDLLCVYDQLIELLEFKEVLLAERPDVWASPRAA